MMKKWILKNKDKKPKTKEEIINILLANRGLNTFLEIDEFLNPPDPSDIDFLISKVDLSLSQIEKAVARIKKAVEKNEKIVVWGDYDVDGICGTAILWEVLKSLGAKVYPFIPNRFTQGYGLDKEIIKGLSEKGVGLVITTDCGITSFEEIIYGNSLGIDFIITDHHQKKENFPEAGSILWTKLLSGAGIAWMLGTKLIGEFRGLGGFREKNQLDLVALATIADLQSLLGVNRILTKVGLLGLNKTQRVGLKALVDVSGLSLGELGTYEVSWMLAPRLNAAGRLKTATDALKLLCTKDEKKAKILAEKLDRINQERQEKTEENLEHARSLVKANLGQDTDGESTINRKTLVVHHEEYHEGVIGLIAGRLKEEYARPVIAISKREKFSKGSARSIGPFDMISSLQEIDYLLEDVGGHKMAAGFTIKTELIERFSEDLEKLAQERLTEEDLKPTLEVDSEINLGLLDFDFFEKIKKFAPFGIGNPTPLFLTKDLRIVDIRSVGRDNSHLKLKVRSSESSLVFSAIGFRLGEWVQKLEIGDKIDLAYNLTENIWNGQRNLELKIKDIRKT